MDKLEIDLIISQNKNLKKQNKELQEENTNLRILADLQKSNVKINELREEIKRLRDNL